MLRMNYQTIRIIYLTVIFFPLKNLPGMKMMMNCCLKMIRLMKNRCCLPNNLRCCMRKMIFRMNNYRSNGMKRSLNNPIRFEHFFLKALNRCCAGYCMTALISSGLKSMKMHCFSECCSLLKDMRNVALNCPG